MTDLGANPAAPGSGLHTLYSKAGGVYVRDPAGVVAGPIGSAGASTLDALTDVDTSTVPPTNTQVLAFQSSSGLWKPAAPSGGGGGSVGYPDALPASPNASDEEFLTTPSGWTTFGSLDAFNITDFPGAGLHVLKNATGVYNLHGQLKPIPSMPFFMWWKVPDIQADTNYQELGSTLSAAGIDGPFFVWGGLVPSNLYGYGIFNTRTNRSAWGGDYGLGRRFQYCGIMVTSTTNLATYVSDSGFIWRPVQTGINPGFTITQFGPFVTGHDNSVIVDGVIKFIRFRAAV